MENQYFKDLGFTFDFYDADNQEFNQKNIKRAIRRITDANRKKYHDLNPNLSLLKFDTKPRFAKSFLMMIKNLSLIKNS